MSNRNQEWFDKMVRGLAKQNWTRAVDGNGTCLYRTTDGKCCAVGHIIPDDAVVVRTVESVSRMVNYPHSYADKNPLERLGLGPIDDKKEVDFLLDAQAAHDKAGTSRSSDMKKNFEDLGKQYSLTWPTDVA